MALLGGITAEDKVADEEIHSILNKISSQIESKLGKFEKLEAESYRTQLVNGINYFIKVHTGDENSRLHVRVYKPISGEPVFVSHLPDKKPNDPISYF